MYKHFFAAALVVCATVARATSYDDFNAGVAAGNRDDPGSAIDLLARALAAKDLPGHLRAVAYLDRGAAYDNQKKYDLAIADFTTSIGLRPNDVVGYMFRASTYDRAKTFDLAIADYSTVLRLKPSLVDVYGFRAEAHENAGQYDLSMADLNTYLKYTPDDASAALHLAFDLWALDQTDKARTGFDHAMELDKTFAYAALWREIARLNAGNSAIRANARQLDSAKWPWPIVSLYLGKTGPDKAEQAAAKGDDLQVLAQQKCEAEFYIGAWQTLQQNNAEAQRLLSAAVVDCADFPLARNGSIVELKKNSAKATP